jgi:hypothetical protein
MILLSSGYFEAGNEKTHCDTRRQEPGLVVFDDGATSSMASLARADCTFLHREKLAYELHVSSSLLELPHMARILQLQPLDLANALKPR